MGKVQNISSPNCSTPSSETFRIDKSNWIQHVDRMQGDRHPKLSRVPITWIKKLRTFEGTFGRLRTDRANKLPNFSTDRL
jgi:hypothetical protein